VFYPSDLYPTVDSLPVGATVYDNTDGVLKMCQLISGYKWTPRDDTIGGRCLIECTVGSHAGRIIKIVDVSTTGEYFFVSDDGGVSWTSRFTNFGRKYFRGCECLINSTTNRIVIGGSTGLNDVDGLVALSDDAGNTWYSVSISGVGPIQMINSFGYGETIALTTTHCLLSTNGGTTWNSYTLDSSLGEINSNSTIVKCKHGSYAGRLIVAVNQTISGSESRIVVSDDGGLSWTRKPTAFADNAWNDVVECQHGSRVGRLVAVGMNEPYVMVSDDSGETWSLKACASSGILQSVVEVTVGQYVGRLVAVGYSGNNVQYSDDSGETWNLLPSVNVPMGGWNSIIECKVGQYSGRLVACAWWDAGTGKRTITSDPTNYLVVL
jgi:photosystem II stability/assembly factor-like uncharacterized protein